MNYEMYLYQKHQNEHLIKAINSSHDLVNAINQLDPAHRQELFSYWIRMFGLQRQ